MNLVFDTVFLKKAKYLEKMVLIRFTTFLVVERQFGITQTWGFYPKLSVSTYDAIAYFMILFHCFVGEILITDCNQSVP